MRSPEDINSALVTLQQAREVMADYLSLKLQEEDWHGVQDAASDLRDIDSKIEMLNKVLGSVI